MALSGVVSLVFGILAAFWPGITFLWLVAMAIYAAYALIRGVVSSIAAVQNRKTYDDWLADAPLGADRDWGRRPLRFPERLRHQ
ncbi:MAG: DUF308 domain-containing protein [Nitrosospira multiformis]|nr:DUF308 domain-containing protein [Nitrosospira multiformis]